AEWHKRFAFPFACLILTAITFITAIQGRHFSTRPRTVMAILFIAMSYYLLLIAGQNLASSGRIPPWLGAWFANIAGALIVIKAFLSNKASFPFLARFTTARHDDPSPDNKQSVSGESNLAASATAAPGSWRLGIFTLISYLLISEVAKYYFIALTALVVTSVIFTLFDLIPAMIRTEASLLYTASYLGYLAPQLAY